MKFGTHMFPTDYSITPADLARFVEEHATETQIDLMEIPAKRRDLAPISMLASLQEGLEILDQTGKEALYVTGAPGMGIGKIYGVITRGEIEKAYRS